MNAGHVLLSDVKKIAVLGPHPVGDFVFCLPALHALRYAYPDAEIIYIGKQWQADFLHGRPGPINRVELIPPCPGVGSAPDAIVDTGTIQDFIGRMRNAEIDLAVQMFGGGRYSNPFILRIGARLTIGIKADDAAPLDRWIYHQGLHNRRLQWLEVVALAGADNLHMGRELQVTESDRHAAGQVIPADPAKPLVMLQPAASDCRRCWPAQRFAAVADVLAEEGALIAINGTEQEAPIVRAVLEHMRHPAVDLSGRLSLSGLCGLLERASLLVSNDTGPLHLALAIGTPCVGIYWLTNLLESGPLLWHKHRAAMSVRVHCPVCGMENMATRCVHDPSFVDDISVDQVTAMATGLLRAG